MSCSVSHCFPWSKYVTFSRLSFSPLALLLHLSFYGVNNFFQGQPRELLMLELTLTVIHMVSKRPMLVWRPSEHLPYLSALVNISPSSAAVHKAWARKAEGPTFLWTIFDVPSTPILLCLFEFAVHSRHAQSGHCGWEPHCWKVLQYTDCSKSLCCWASGFFWLWDEGFTSCICTALILVTANLRIRLRIQRKSNPYALPWGKTVPLTTLNARFPLTTFFFLVKINTTL